MRNDLITLLVLVILSTSSSATELLMLTDDAPPHMIEVSHNGIDVDITREVLLELGYKVKLGFAPLQRSMIQVKHKKADLFLPTFFQKDTPGLFISKAIINYRPTAFSLKKNNFHFKKILDLVCKKVLTFQGATGYFSEDFLTVSQSKNYQELHGMSKFPEMLIKERYDVVVLDYYIFYYFLQEYLKKNPSDNFNIEEIDLFVIFTEVKAHVGFNDKKLRDKFNKQLELYKIQDKEKVVIGKYIKTVNLQ